MSNSPYSICGPQLNDLGYVAIPIMPGTKSPGEFYDNRWLRMTGWSRRYATRGPSDSQISSWCNLSDAGVCVVTGKVSKQLVGVDLDCEEVVAAISEALPYTPCIKRGQKGKTLLYRANLPYSQFNRPLPGGHSERLLDFLSDGQQTILPPTIHPDTGRGYQWIGEQPLEEVPPDQLPLLPEDTFEHLEELLTPFGYCRDKSPHRHLIMSGKALREAFPNKDYDSLPPYQQVNALAWDRLDRWVDALHLCRAERTHTGWQAVADWRSSNTDRPISHRKLNLHINATKNTICDFGDGPKGYSPIDLVAAVNGRGTEAAFEWLAHKIGWYEDPVGLPTIKLSGKIKPVENAPAPPATTIAPTEKRGTDKPLWQVPGLVGEITQYIIDTAEYRQPMFSLSAALTLVGAAASRQMLGPTRSATHIYVVAVGNTASGKEHPLSCIKKILELSNLTDRFLGPSSFTSTSSLVNRVLVPKPCAIAIIDEIGMFMSKGKGKNAASYEAPLFGALRSLWSNCGDMFLTEAKLMEEEKIVYSPCLSIYGASAPKEMFKALSDADLANGFLNRFLLFHNPDYPPYTDKIYERYEVPSSIIDGLKAVADRGKDACDRYHKYGDQPLSMNQYVVPWASPDVGIYFKQRREAVRATIMSNPDLANFLGRASEYAIRLATILAVGVDSQNPKVTMEHVKWGEEVAMQCFTNMARVAKAHMAAGFREENINKVRRAAANMLKNGEGWFQVREIMSRVQPLSKKEIDEILSYLMDLGEVIRDQRVNIATDTKRRDYFKYVNKELV